MLVLLLEPYSQTICLSSYLNSARPRRTVKSLEDAASSDAHYGGGRRNYWSMPAASGYAACLPRVTPLLRSINGGHQSAAGCGGILRLRTASPVRFDRANDRKFRRRGAGAEVYVRPPACNSSRLSAAVRRGFSRAAPSATAAAGAVNSQKVSVDIDTDF